MKIFLSWLIIIIIVFIWFAVIGIWATNRNMFVIIIWIAITVSVSPFLILIPLNQMIKKNKDE